MSKSRKRIAEEEEDEEEDLWSDEEEETAKKPKKRTKQSFMSATEPHCSLGSSPRRSHSTHSLTSALLACALPV